MFHLCGEVLLGMEFNKGRKILGICSLKHARHLCGYKIMQLRVKMGSL